MRRGQSVWFVFALVGSVCSLALAADDATKPPTSMPVYTKDNAPKTPAVADLTVTHASEAFVQEMWDKYRPTINKPTDGWKKPRATSGPATGPARQN